MIPIAIVWETRKTYIKSTDAYKGFAKFVLKSFGYKIWGVTLYRVIFNQSW